MSDAKAVADARRSRTFAGPKPPCLTADDRAELRLLVVLLVAAKAILEECGVESATLTVTTRGGQENEADISPAIYEGAGLRLQAMLDRLDPLSAVTASRGEGAH